ncbi:hypothetical protein LWI28_014043 [Acer negundo]|uniref:Uncharacterized protein n=1 Tax=Acer negundo TaxID=4023 RepID=A0AAD5NFF2_ACENE|nr:hypothetical protein LWI28_014043 [Acer negundo]KAK4833845.1 hypothetical protein QYF36_012249 [Acer negundo]
MTITAAADKKLRPKSGRKPLHPINSPISTTPKPKAKQEWTDQNQIAMDKENSNNNHYKVKMETLDASLAEELSAIRKKMERLRIDRERTEKMLEERAAAMETHLKEIQQRGEIQKTFELEVDRLYRLNQLKSYCLRISTIRTLREKEEDKRMGEGEAGNSHQYQEDEEESVGDNSPLCPTPTSSELVTDN